MITFGDIQTAHGAIRDQIVDTPCLKSDTLSAVFGAAIYLKFENLQFTASFKERGALNKLLHLSAQERQKGVIAMSAGNHAQSLAYHAQRLGIPATIVMPKATPYVKIRQTAHFGAKVILEGQTLADAADFAHVMAERDGLTFVHPYDDDHVIAGQGTIAVEMLNAIRDLDILIVPVGGGGMIGGMAVAAKALRPDIHIIGVEAALYPSLHAALNGTNAECGGNSIAEGIAVKRVGQRNLALARQYVDDVVVVSETELERAIYMLLTIEKTVVEGAGGAGLAAVIANQEFFRGKKVGIPLCGGNIDPRLLASVITRELMREGRIARFGVDVADSPGQLARVAGIVGDYGCSVIEVFHHRLSLDMSAKHTMLEMMIEARDQVQVAEIIERLRSEGFTVKTDNTPQHPELP